MHCLFEYVLTPNDRIDDRCIRGWTSNPRSSSSFTKAASVNRGGLGHMWPRSISPAVKSSPDFTGGKIFSKSAAASILRQQCRQSVPCKLNCLAFGFEPPSPAPMTTVMCAPRVRHLTTNGAFPNQVIHTKLIGSE